MVPGATCRSRTRESRSQLAQLPCRSILHETRGSLGNPPDTPGRDGLAACIPASAVAELLSRSAPRREDEAAPRYTVGMDATDLRSRGDSDLAEKVLAEPLVRRLIERLERDQLGPKGVRMSTALHSELWRPASSPLKKSRRARCANLTRGEGRTFLTGC